MCCIAYHDRGRKQSTNKTTDAGAPHTVRACAPARTPRRANLQVTRKTTSCEYNFQFIYISTYSVVEL